MISPRRDAAPSAGSFTLVELLIVVVVIGILAAIIIPQFTNVSGDAKLGALNGDLAMVRKQLEIYRHEHNGNYPSFAAFEQQMTSRTNADGTQTGSPKLGPYLHDIPINPFTNATDLGLGACGSSSWYYDETTGEFRANCHAAHCPL